MLCTMTCNVADDWGWPAYCRWLADECLAKEARMAEAEAQVAEMRAYNRKGAEMETGDEIYRN